MLMNKIPENLKEKIIIDTIILNKRIKWNNIHKEIVLLKNKPIQTVILIDNKLFRYYLRYYKNCNHIIELPKLNNTQKFFSFGYVSRITDNSIKWNQLPWLKNVNVNDFTL